MIVEGFEELDKLGWIKQVDDAERYQKLADAYLAAVAEKKRNGEYKSALVVSPTHKELDQISDAIRAGLKAQGRLGKERIVTAWVPTHLTDAEKSDPTQYESGRHAPVPSERPWFHQGIAFDRRRKGHAADRSLPSGSRSTGRLNSPWPWATASVSRRAARPRTASIA